MNNKQEVLDKIEEVKQQIKERKLPPETIDLFFQGFATGMNFEASYYQNTNYDSLAFWGKLCDEN